MLYRQIILEWGQDTESGVWGLGYSPDNGKNFYVLNTTHGRKYRAEDGNRLYPYISDQIQDKIDTVVAPAKSAADSAVSAADAAVASAQVTSDAVSAIASATAEAKQGASEAMSRAKSAWDVATGAKEAVTEFDPLLKSAQSDASKALTQIADTASALSDAKISFGSDMAAANELANTAQATAEDASGQAVSAVTTANGAMTAAKNAKSDVTVAIQTASGASLVATNAQSDATIAKQTASEATVQASNAESDFAQLSIRANKIEANVANNSGAIANVKQTADGLTTTVANIKANGGGVNLAHNTSNAYVFTGGQIWGSKNIGSLSNDEWVALAGETITIGVTVEWTNWKTSDKNRIGFEIAPAKNGNGYWNNSFGLWCHPDNGSSGKQRLTVTRTINNDIDGVVGGLAYVQGGCDTARIGELMIERGPVAHDWSPSPADLQDKFTQIKTSIDGVTTTINDPKTGLNATYQTAAGNVTTISNVKSDVYQLQATANGLTSRVGNLESKTNTQQTAIEQNKNAIALKADQTDVDTVKGTVAGLQSSLTVQGNQIQTKVSASDVSGMLKGYATQDYTQSLVTQQANTLSSTITTVKNQVNSLESAIDWTTKTGALDMDTLTTTQNIYYRDTNLKNADGEAGWAYIQVVSMGERVTQTVWHDRSSIQHTRTGAVSGSSYNWDAWNRTATNAQISNLTQSLDGLRSTVAAKADQSEVTQLSNLIQAKVSSGDFTSTTTQLKNMINQRVQVGDVISQINQEAGGDTLIQVSNGKKSLILDAGNTVFTGKAWIPVAAIANLTADQVQAGTLSGSKVHAGDNSGNAIDMGALSAGYVGFHAYANNGDNTYIDYNGIHNYGASYDTRIQQGKITTNYLTVNGGGMIDFRDSNGTGMVAQGSTLTFDVGNTPAGYLSYNGMPVAEIPDGSGGNELAIRYGLSAAIIPNDNSGAQATFSGAAQKIGYMTGTNQGKQMLSGLEVHSNNHHWFGAVNSDATWNRIEINSNDGVNLAWHDNTHFWISDGNAKLYKDNNDSSTATKLEVHGWAWINGWCEAAGHFQHSTLSSKTRIEEADPDHMLDLINQTELTTFAYKSELAGGTNHRHIGPIIDDINDVAQYQIPSEFIAPTKTARDDDNMIGALFGAVQALTKRIKKLEDKLNG